MTSTRQFPAFAVPLVVEAPPYVWRMAVKLTEYGNATDWHTRCCTLAQL